MQYFVTGGTGFIGRNLIANLVKRGGTVHVLVRSENAQEKLVHLQQQTGAADKQLLPVYGDLSKPRLGLSDAVIDELSYNLPA